MNPRRVIALSSLARRNVRYFSCCQNWNPADTTYAGAVAMLRASGILSRRLNLA